MTDTASKYTFYILRGLPAGVFGEAYVVVASTTGSTMTFRAEHYILTQRPQESLRSGVWGLRRNGTKKIHKGFAYPMPIISIFP
jgi:hypothetical protein